MNKNIYSQATNKNNKSNNNKNSSIVKSPLTIAPSFTISARPLTSSFESWVFSAVQFSRSVMSDSASP